MSELKQLATDAGLHTLANVTIKQIEAKPAAQRKDGSMGKPYWLVWLEGYSGRIMSSDAPSYAVGDVVTITIEARESKNGGAALDIYTAKPKGQGGGGGGRGGFGSPPKTREEIHSASLCGVIKSCIEQGKTPQEAKGYLDLYVDYSGRLSK